MSMLAITTDQTLWWITLGGGLLVAILVLILLEALRRTVVRIDHNVTAVWSMGKRLAQNTQTAHMLETTKDRGAELREALERDRPRKEAEWRPS